MEQKERWFLRLPIYLLQFRFAIGAQNELNDNARSWTALGTRVQ